MSHFTLDDLVLAVAKYSNSFVSPVARQRIAQIVLDLPREMRSEFGLELSLDELPGADFVVRLFADDKALITLAGRSRSQKRWQDLTNLSRLWTNPDSMIADWANCVWLEFDTASAPDAFQVPKLFISLMNCSWMPRYHSVVAHWVSKNALPALIGPCVDNELTDAVSTAIKALPPASHVGSFGALSRNGVSAARILVSAPPAVAPQQLLPGPIDESIMRAWRWSPELALCKNVQLEIRKTGSSRYWLELSFDDCHDADAWKELLLRLNSEGWVTTSRMHAIHQWIGDTHCENGMLRRGISHIKITSTSGNLQGRAYLQAKWVGESSDNC